MKEHVCFLLLTLQQTCHLSDFLALRYLASISLLNYLVLLRAPGDVESQQSRINSQAVPEFCISFEVAEFCLGDKRMQYSDVSGTK